MKKLDLLLVSALLLAPALCNAADDDVIYVRAQRQPGNAEKIVREVYGKTHRIVEFGDKGHTYVPPKGISGFGAIPPVMDGNKCVAGKGSALFIITAAGNADAPNVTASDSRLVKSAMLTVQGWQFHPARLDGKAVATVFAAPLSFNCPVAGAQK